MVKKITSLLLQNNIRKYLSIINTNSYKSIFTQKCLISKILNKNEILPFYCYLEFFITHQGQLSISWIYNINNNDGIDFVMIILENLFYQFKQITIRIINNSLKKTYINGGYIICDFPLIIKTIINQKYKNNNNDNKNYYNGNANKYNQQKTTNRNSTISIST